MIYMDNPVLLLPGYTDSEEDLTTLAAYLWEAGFQVHPFAPQPSDGSVLLEDLAAQLQAFIDLTFGSNQPVDVVAFSMGGLISRWYVQKLGGWERVQRLVTLATPHNGTLYAYMPVNSPGLRQMQPGSDFLNELNGDLLPLTRINFTSIWTPLDLTVFPATSCLLDVGKTVRLMLPHHRALLSYRRCFAAVVKELRAPVKRLPKTVADWS